MCMAPIVRKLKLGVLNSLPYVITDRIPCQGKLLFHAVTFYEHVYIAHIYRGLLGFQQSCDIARSHVTTSHEKRLTWFIYISFPCFDKTPSYGARNMLQMGRLAWKLEKWDSALMDVTRSNLTFTFNFHLAPLIDSREEEVIPRFK